MWNDAIAMLPDALGAARLECGDGGWQVSRVAGEVDTDWALATLRAGESAFDGEAAGSEVEMIVRRDELTVIVADARCVVVLRLSRDANVGMALGFARQQVRA